MSLQLIQSSADHHLSLAEEERADFILNMQKFSYSASDGNTHPEILIAGSDSDLPATPPPALNVVPFLNTILSLREHTRKQHTRP